MSRFVSSVLALTVTSALAASAVGCADASEESTDEMPSVTWGTTTQSLTSTMEAVASFGSNPGGLKLYKYVPKTLPAGAPLVLVLHGCTEGANDAAAWGWNELADQSGFAVGYPEQTTANNQMQCFNWGGVYGDMSSLARGQGENE